MRDIRNKIKSQIGKLEKRECWRGERPYLKDRYLDKEGHFQINEVSRRLHQILYRTVRSEVARTDSVMTNLKLLSITRKLLTQLEALGI